MSELGISATESYLRIHANLHGHAALHGRCEAPLSEMTNGALVRLWRERTKDPDDPGRAVLLQYDVEHDQAGRVEAAQRDPRHADDARGRDARADERGHVVGDQLVDAFAAKV